MVLISVDPQILECKSHLLHPLNQQKKLKINDFPAAELGDKLQDVCCVKLIPNTAIDYTCYPIDSYSQTHDARDANVNLNR